MLLNQNSDQRDRSTCTLSYNESERWLQAVWQGYVDPLEAQRGAEAYLHHAAQTPSPYLLNDNSQLRGPWFDSLEWLADIWVPQAAQLGLRYVAHILQADRHSDIIPRQLPASLPFELQVFRQVADAQQWLRQCRG